MSARTIVTTAALAAALAATTAVPATAADGDVRVSRKCTGPSTIKLKLSPDDGRLEVEAEVDRNRNGVRWQWKLLRGTRQLATGTAVTRAPSGSFEVRRLVADQAGQDRITVRATRPGETCVVTARI